MTGGPLDLTYKGGAEGGHLRGGVHGAAVQRLRSMDPPALIVLPQWERHNAGTTIKTWRSAVSTPGRRAKGPGGDVGGHHASSPTTPPPPDRHQQLPLRGGTFGFSTGKYIGGLDIRRLRRLPAHQPLLRCRAAPPSSHRLRPGPASSKNWLSGRRRAPSRPGRASRRPPSGGHLRREAQRVVVLTRVGLGDEPEPDVAHGADQHVVLGQLGQARMCTSTVRVPPK